MSEEKWKPPLNKTVLFKGCVWDAHWEFDCPAIIYSPVCIYSDNNSSLDKCTVENMVEDLCVDICVNGYAKKKFSKLDLKDFNWRGWSIKNIIKRKNTINVIVPVIFKNGKEGLEFEIKNKE